VKVTVLLPPMLTVPACSSICKNNGAIASADVELVTVAGTFSPV